MKRYTYHGITIQYADPDEELDLDAPTAIFGPDDFERWFKEGASRTDRCPDSAREQLFENCLYLTDVEERVLLQTPAELRDAIDTWADEWNASRRGEEAVEPKAGTTTR
jgi:hypothetical protein